ncbi:hypothetical protein N825_26625 [Skermanella stibiiresistens SB22]|uniref:Uncharacterized protein n=1 Tax=Skermanella stibiiresistens SB22 TaxID=1385369 RepID=W9GYF0_9PROT|nr:hypothetical protein [Skermanella stibiiresistens]EWY36508.1 hypothetical protein N825_26625 [Skermanella stibiiresistens SB22]
MALAVGLIRRIGVGLFGGAVVVAVVSGAVFVANPDEHREPTDAEIREGLISLARETTPRVELERRIAESLAGDDPEGAADYFQLADLTGVEIDPDLKHRFAEETAFLPGLMRSAGAGTRGFVTGDGEGTAGTVGAVLSDLTVIGDLRDATAQTGHYLRGEEVDEVMLALSAAGIGLTAATLATAGVALPVKLGVSVAKVARRTGKMSKEFAHSIVELARLGNTAKLRDAMRSVGAIGGATSPRGALTVIRSLDHVDELPKAERIAAVMGKPTAGLFKVAGRRVLTAVSKVAVRSVAAVWALVALIASAVIGLVGLVLSAVTTLKVFKGLFRLGNAAV